MSFGRAWDERTGRVTDVQQIGREIFESMRMGCMEQFTAELRRTNAILAGEQVTLEDENGDPQTYDYTETGLSPRLDAIAARFITENLIYPDENVADILMGGLIGRQLDLSFPWSGTGLADITDEQLTTLHGRFRQADITLPFGSEKNITETLETLLRTDKVTDLEFLTPNITTVFRDTLNTGDAGIVPVLKAVVAKLTERFDLPARFVNWLNGKLESQEHLSTADILLLILEALQRLEQTSREAEMSPTINLNNYNGCCDEADCNCEAETQTYTFDDENCIEEPTINLNGGTTMA